MAGAETLQKVSYAEIITRLTRARKMNVSGLSAEDVDRRVGLIMNGYHTVAIKGQLNGLYRARKNIGDQPCQSTSDLWYPPASAVLNRGRFNEPGAPVFYACNRGVGAIFEVCPNIGDIITLLVVRAKTEFAELDCAHIGLERSFAPELGGTQRGLMLRNNPQFQAMLKQYNISKKWLMVDEFLSEMATTLFPLEQEQEKYKITNAIARVLLRIPNVQALNYPSVATRRSSLNLCLPPQIADQYFAPAETWMIRIEEAADKLPGVNEPWPFYRTTFFRRSETIEPDGHIRWSDFLQNVDIKDIAHLAYRPGIPA